MDLKIESIRRHPVKGLSAEILSHIDLEKDQGLPFDRRFAITHGSSEYDFRANLWVPRRNFVVVAHSPSIVRLASSLSAESNTIHLHLAGREVARLNTNDDCEDVLNSVLSELIGKVQAGPYQLVSEHSRNNLTDSPSQTVSLMSDSSLNELSCQFDTPLVRERFRGNIWFSGGTAWEELEWIGRELLMGDVHLKVIEPIVRCAAIDVDPTSGIQAPQVLKKIVQKFGHTHFGVLAQIVRSGNLSIGDELKISK